MAERKFYQVLSFTELWYMKLPEHTMHGFETERLFRAALQRIVDRWRCMVGERLAERYDQYRMRFVGCTGVVDEVWLPKYILKEVPMPDHIRESEPGPYDEILKTLDEAFEYR